MKEGIIRLLDTSGTTVLDSVSTEYEDSFTLETFGDSIEAHYECEPKGSKSFIIARTQTWDVKQPGKVFYSYYSAYQLNKILFQTQVYLGKKLIHRLHVLNPLTNTDIIGDVQYFIIRLNKEQGAQASTGSSEGRGGDEGRGGPPPAVLQESEGGGGGGKLAKSESKANMEDRAEIAATVPVEDLEAPAAGDGVNLVPTIDTITPSKPAKRGGRPSTAGPLGAARRKMSLAINTAPPGASRYLDLPPPSPSVREIEKGELPSWTLSGPLVKEITEEEPLGTGPLRRKFSLATLRLTSPYPTAISPPRGPKSAYPTSTSSQRDPENFIITVPLTPSTARDGMIPEESGDEEGTAKVHIVTKPPQGFLMLNTGTKQQRTQVPFGTATRFGKSIADREGVGAGDDVVSSTPPARRRALSLLNYGAEADKMEEWMKAVAQRPRTAGPGRRASGKDGDDGEATVDVESPAAAGDTYTDTDTPAASSATTATALLVTYDAVLVATDTDYLETSRTRTLFRTNAVTPADVKLFEMEEYTGLSSPPPVVIIDDTWFCDWCFPSDQRLSGMTPVVRWIHRLKFWFVLAGVAAGLGIMVYYVSKSDAKM
ncbi:uncharacterized protein EV422DRAFT_507240 [Fimicolochytrium jonesii]|uniref:uncharacterized protein n=1 Tax=Fimicolochytrium jonesii TaxID=1396493 RepID=UPI0022FE5F09|nr:uncharacterized protein EV422DRAFT_507240 [Fimicolochytrium jonesii]KAI8819595.1 hypothetical protein EV422DRAFT_507240 [Fimicolochytrium jonesii]